MDQKLLDALPALLGSAGSSEFVCKLLCCSRSLAARIEAVAANALTIKHRTENTQQLQQLAKWLQNARNRALVRVVDLHLQWLNSRNGKTLVDIIHLLTQPDRSNKLRTLAIDEALDNCEAVSLVAAALLSAADSDHEEFPATNRNSPDQLTAGRLSSGGSAFGTANVAAEGAATAASRAAPVVCPDNLPANVISCKFRAWQLDEVCSLLHHYVRVFAGVHLEYSIYNSTQSDHFSRCCTVLASKLRSIEFHSSDMTLDDDDGAGFVSILQQVADVAATAAAADSAYQLVLSYCGSYFPGLLETAAEMPDSIVLESLTLDVSRSIGTLELDGESLVLSQLPMLTNLKNLLIRDVSSHSMQYLTSVSRLTQLQSLGMDLGSYRPKAQALLQHIPTLSNLQSLKLEFDSAETGRSERGVWLEPAFAQLTALTKLDMKTESDLSEPRFLLRGSSIPKSMEWLEIDGFMDLSDLMCLSSLKTLVLGREFLASGVGGLEYQRLTCLSNLSMICASIGRVEVVSQLHDFACVWGELPIKQLSMEVHAAHGFKKLPLQYFSGLLQLQDLSIYVYDSLSRRSGSHVMPLDFGALAACLQHCTGLRKLGLVPFSYVNMEEPEAEGSVTFVNALSKLPALQELRLRLPGVDDAMIGLRDAPQLTSLICKVSSPVAECLWHSLPNVRMLDNIIELVRRT